MKIKTRLLFIFLVFCVQCIYFPINRLVSGGKKLNLPFDDQIPLWPIWAIPYLLSLLWWTGSFFWASIKMDDILYKRMILSILLIMLSSYVFYIFCPTYVIRPELNGTGWQTELMRFIYGNDRVNNAFPSGHTYTSVLIMIVFLKWIPKKWWLWLSITVIILLSTLFTRQHYIPDLLGGIVFAMIGYWISSKLIPPKRLEFERQ